MTTIQQTLFGGGGGGSGSATRTVSSTTTNLDVKTLFGADYTTNSNKTLIINSGVTVGGTDSMKPAMDIPSGMGGSMNIINYGSILGTGGKGGTRSLRGYKTVACTTNGGGRIVTISYFPHTDDIGTVNPSGYPNGRPAACLWDLNGNKIKQWYLPLSNPTINNTRDQRVAIGGNRIFIAINAVSYSGSHFAGEGFHIYDLNGNLQSGGTPIKHGNASPEWCHSVAANSNYVVIGDTGFTNAGRVYVYDHSGNHIANWNGTDTGSGDAFGAAVDINEANDIVVGAPYKNNGTNNGGASASADGAAYYFPNFNNSSQVKLMSNRAITGYAGNYPSYSNQANNFGREVLIGKSTIVVASPATKLWTSPSPSTGDPTQSVGEVKFYNFSGTLLASKSPETTRTNGYFDGYRFGMCGMAKPNPEPASGDEYWLVCDQAGTGYQSYWNHEQHVLMYDSSFNRVGCFGSYNSHSLNLPATNEGQSSICMTGANSEYPRVILAGGMKDINHGAGGMMIFEHDQFRLAPNAQPFPANPAAPTLPNGKAAFEHPIVSPDVNGDVNQAGIITDKYLKFTYNLWGDDGGDAIRCDSPNVGINNQGTIYGGGGGGATGATATTANGGPSTPFTDAIAGTGGQGGDGEGYNLSRTNAPSAPASGIQQGGNGGAYGQSGGHGGGSPFDDPWYVTSYQNYGQVYYSDRVRRGYFKFNHRKTMFLRSAEWTANPTNLGGRAGFISTSTNGNSLNFINQGTTAGRS